jgi:hypothetical protein
MKFFHGITRTTRLSFRTVYACIGLGFGGLLFVDFNIQEYGDETKLPCIISCDWIIILGTKGGIFV